jgi:hypothetical protein
MGDASEAKDESPGTARQEQREEFLFRMYDQMWRNIERHTVVIWHSIGALIAASVVLSRVQTDSIEFDVASALMVFVSGWQVANVLVAAQWFNRNMHIVGNIERQFLKRTDVRQIHWYFQKPQEKWEVIDYLQVQLALGVVIGLFFLLYHFVTRVLPGIGAPWANFEAARTLPYLVFVACAVALGCQLRTLRAHYRELLKKSPGISLATDD